MVEAAALLVDEVFPVRPIRQWVLAVPFPLRFLFAAYPELMGKGLSIVTRAISTHLARQAGFTKREAPTGAVTLIQRFGSALNLNIHFHMLFLDGVYVQHATDRHCFRRTAPPTVEQLHVLLHQISERVAIAEKRLSMTSTGKVRYELKTPFRNGTTHVIFEPLDFMARLAALVPKPRVNLTRFHGVFAPNSKHRALITPAGRGKGSKQANKEGDDRSFTERHAAMTFAQRLKRVFHIDIETCEKCQGPVRIIACVEDPVAIKQILGHLVSKETSAEQTTHPLGRAPPQLGLFDQA